MHNISLAIGRVLSRVAEALFRIHHSSSEKMYFFARRGIFSLDLPFNGRPPFQ